MTLSSLHSHYSHRTAAHMVLGPGGMSSGYKSHRNEDKLINNDVHVERINREVEEQRRLKSQQRSRKKKKRNMISANLSGTRYEVGK